jgi:hypothetical protein
VLSGWGMHIVKFSCGCIGFAFEPQALVLDACDADRCDPYPSHMWRDLSDKTYEPLDESAARDLLTVVAELVDDGHSLRDVRRLLVP